MTRRLDLAPYDAARDLGALHAMFADPEWARAGYSAPSHSSDESHERLQREFGDNGGWTWVLHLRPDDTAIGVIGIFSDQGTPIRGARLQLASPCSCSPGCVRECRPENSAPSAAPAAEHREPDKPRVSTSLATHEPATTRGRTRTTGSPMHRLHDRLQPTHRPWLPPQLEGCPLRFSVGNPPTQGSTPSNGWLAGRIDGHASVLSLPKAGVHGPCRWASGCPTAAGCPLSWRVAP